MTNFLYVAIDKSNAPATGIIDQADRASVIASLKKQGLRPISIKQASSIANSGRSLSRFFNSNRVKPDHLVMMTRQLSAMVGAGVPLVRSLTSLADHSESPMLKKILIGVIKDVEAGTTLGDALSKYPDTFNDVYVNMVRAGETAGILD